jgi:hypothetical protein
MILFEKLTGFQLVKTYPAFYSTRRLIEAFTGACDMSLSWAKSIQYMPLIPLLEFKDILQRIIHFTNTM